MFSFHSRSRSLIPVAAIKDMEKSDAYVEEVEDLEDVEESRQHTSQHVLIYLLFVADAIMQSSLSSQIDALLDSSCLTMETSFLRSILQCAYYFGSALGIAWGLAADTFGRRRTALFSLVGSLICCVSMGFATTFGAFAFLRVLAGAVGSAAPISGLAMLADITHGKRQRTWVIARLPVVVVCGQIGPLLSGTIRHFAQDRLQGLFLDYPALGGQVTCGFLVLGITIVEFMFLKETLPTMVHKDDFQEEYIDCEKAAFLGQSHSNDSQDSLAISIVDALKDDTTAPAPSHISISQLFTAPSVLILLASFSALSLHSSAFDALLPHLGNDPSQNCGWLQPVSLAIKILAAVSMLYLPLLVKKIGLVQLYRRTSVVFPALYVVVPVAALAANSCGDSTILAGVFSTFATLLKTTLAGAAQVLVLLIALSAAPDASSTGTLIGVISISELFKALAVGIAGISYFLSDEYSMIVINGALWAALATIALLGAVITQRLRETPRVGTDLPEECFVWQGVFDADSSDDEAGF